VKVEVVGVWWNIRRGESSVSLLTTLTSHVIVVSHHADVTCDRGESSR